METEVRAFFEVLTELKVDDKLQQLFEPVGIKKVVFEQATEHLEIYLSSKELLNRPMLLKMQRAIKDQLLKPRLSLLL